MYAGHFAVGLALAARFPELRPAVVLFGVGLLDLLDGVLVAAGVEKVSAAPSLPLGFTLDFIDFDHSLLMALLWSAVYGAAFLPEVKVAQVAFLAAASHWLLDLPVHQADLALWPYAPLRLGLGLWERFPVGSWFLEGALVAALAAYWLRGARPPRARARWVLGLLLALHLSFSPWLSVMKALAAHGPAESLAFLHGLLVFLGFLVPALVFTQLLRPRPTSPPL